MLYDMKIILEIQPV